jgi:hypothetical protein
VCPRVRSNHRLRHTSAITRAAYHEHYRRRERRKRTGSGDAPPTHDRRRRGHLYATDFRGDGCIPKQTSDRRRLFAAPGARREVRDKFGPLRHIHCLLREIRDRHFIKAVLGFDSVTAGRLKHTCDFTKADDDCPTRRTPTHVVRGISRLPVIR